MKQKSAIGKLLANLLKPLQPFSWCCSIFGTFDRIVCSISLATTRRVDRTIHVKHIHLNGDMNNNKMERMNGEVRDREKVMRGIKKMDSPIFKGYQLYHNYFRDHDTLGKTPAEAANIKIEGRNKWVTVIQNASRN